MQKFQSFASRHPPCSHGDWPAGLHSSAGAGNEQQDALPDKSTPQSTDTLLIASHGLHSPLPPTPHICQVYEADRWPSPTLDQATTFVHMVGSHTAANGIDLVPE